MTDYIEERLPPHNVEAEAAVLGSILIDQDVMVDLADTLAPAAFYRTANRWVYEAITALHSRRDAIDILTVAAELRSTGHLEDIGGEGYLFDLLNAVPTSINAEHYAGIVAEKATRRRILALAGSMAKAAYDEATPVDEAMSAAERGIIDARGGSKSPVMDARQIASEYLDDFFRSIEAGQPANGISTGLTDLDAILGGMSAPHQYVVTGRTGMGKSSLALAIAANAILNQRKRVMIFSPEMSVKQVTNRICSIMTGIPVIRVTRPWILTDLEHRQVTEAIAQINETGLFVDPSPGPKPGDIRARATRAQLERGLDMVIVDHMHLLRTDVPVKGGNRTRELGDIVLSLAETYKVLDVVGVTLAQLNRAPEGRATKQPILSDLRDSGEIEENAYAVIMLYRAGYYDPLADQNIAVADVVKNRDGKTGQAQLFWHAELSTFKNLAHTDLNPPRSNGRVATAARARQGEIVL